MANLRASAQTDPAGRFPLHAVCAWLGNSEAIADKHYLRVTDADFEQALIPVVKSVERGADQTAQNTTRATEAGAVAGSRQETENEKPPVYQGVSTQESGPAGIRTQNQRIMSPLL